MTDSSRVASGESSLDELDAHAVAGQLLHNAPQVVEVARQPVHAMHHHGVALAHKGERPVQFRTVRVLPGRRVGKEPIDRDLLELTFRVLVETAHPDIADAVTVHGVRLPPVCQDELFGSSAELVGEFQSHE